MATVSGQVTTTRKARTAHGRSGMSVPRVFSTEGISPFDQVDWEHRTAEIKDERGRVIFQQTDCEVPRFWSQFATNVVASKYFYGRAEYARAGNQRPPVDRPRHPDHQRLGSRGRLFRNAPRMPTDSTTS